MTKERIEKELIKVRSQISELETKKRDLEEQLHIADEAEKMRYIEKHKISLEKLTLLNRISEEEILSLLKKKETEEQEQKQEKIKGENGYGTEQIIA